MVVSRYRIHGLEVVTNVPVATWTRSPGNGPTSAGDPWRIAVHTNCTDASDEVTPHRGPARWEWRETPGRTTLDVSGTPPGWDPAVATAAQFHVNYSARSIDVCHSHDDIVGCFDLLTRWILPDLARTELGLVPLHACAVETPGGALLILGDSGRGKSTLTAALLAAGAGFLGDEPICADARGAWPGSVALRIAPTAAGDSPEVTGVVDGAGKVLWIHEVDASHTRPLASLVVLSARRPSGQLVRWRRMNATEALVAVMGLRYSRSQQLDRMRGDLRRAAELVTTVPVLDVSLLEDRNRVVEAAAQLLGVVADLGATSPTAG